MTLNELETALLNNRLELRAGKWPGKWYKVWRIGATKRWKRSPEKFVIPCEIAFNGCYSIADSYATKPGAISFNDASRLRITND